MLRENIQSSLKDAMKQRDMDTVNAIRLIIAGLKEKDVDARGKGKEQASDEDLLSMMQSMVKQRNESIQIYTTNLRPDLAAKEQKEIDVIMRFLPKQLEKDEIIKVIKRIITESGCNDVKDMGKIMSQLKQEYAGKIDFSTASSIVKEILS